MWRSAMSRELIRGVQGGLAHGGGQLAAQIVQDEQVAGEVAFHRRIGLLAPAEFGVLEVGEDGHGGVVDHAEPLFADHPGDAGGQEGLAQPRRPGEKEVAHLVFAEFLRVTAADLFHHPHVLPVGHAQLVVVLGGIPVQREGLKALVPQLQQGGQAL